jgi:hypothetical protein
MCIYTHTPIAVYPNCVLCCSVRYCVNSSCSVGATQITLACVQSFRFDQNSSCNNHC